MDRAELYPIVGATGFEPAAAWSQTRSATGLRYTPNKMFAECGKINVGATGFEPAAAWSQTRSATGLRYTPNILFFSSGKCLPCICGCKGTTFS